MGKFIRAVAAAAAAIAATSQLCAQRPGGDWTTIGNDAQRSSWVRSDGKISPETMRKPGFQLVWKLNLKNEARQLSSVTPPALFDFYIGYRGFRSLAFVGGSSGNVIGIDVDLGRIEWEKSFGSGSPAASSLLCPGGMTSSVSRPTAAAYPAAFIARGAGRGGPAKSGVGEPFEGAVTLKDQFQPPPTSEAKPGRRTTPPPNPYAPRRQYVHALSADGKFHSLYVSNGEEPDPPVAFLPPNANAAGLIVVDNVAYTATINGCAGVENGVWALDLGSKKVTRWKSSGGIAGSAGFTVGPDGTLYVASTGGEIVALEPRTLKVMSSFKGRTKFTSTPVVFEYKGKDLIAAATSDGRIQLFDTAALSGNLLAQSAPFSTANFATGALASWQDASGTRWVLAPAGPGDDIKNGAIVAFQIVDENGATTLRRGWALPDMISPLPPAIVNGVVFALSSGEFRSSDARTTVQRSSKAVLYALDSATGKELWNSGDAITSFVHSGGLASGGGRVYVGDHEATQYAFGFPMEH